MPEDLPSGVYAVRLRAQGIEQHVPFLVGPGRRRKDVAVLFPTATYLAYANDRIAFEADGMEMLLGHTPIVHKEDLVLQDHPEFGRSLYEIHNDGSGVVFGSVRRPLISLQPRYRASFMSEGPWGLPADLSLVHWLETAECEFDALTDEDLDREGHDLLRDYRVVITGSHPEYVTRRELDALEEFTASGGRLMYLGGNGFFATASYDPDAPHLMELRRADGGTRPHQSPFAERRHTTSGEASGLWRNKGKAPQRLVGVGMAAQGFDRCTYYERLADSHDPRAAFVFEGVGENELLGDFGIIGGGAAGAEIDCWNPALGSPPGSPGPGHLRALLRQLPAGDRGDLRDAPGNGRNRAAGGPLGHGLLRAGGRRRILLGRIHRLDRVAVPQRVRQQRREDHRQRTAALPRREAAGVGHPCRRRQAAMRRIHELAGEPVENEGETPSRLSTAYRSRPVTTDAPERREGRRSVPACRG